METKIAEVEGYTIVYEPRDKAFYLKDAGGEVVGQGKTQDEVEEQAKKLAKHAFKPVAAVLTGNLKLELGRVTSINLGDQTIRFAFDEKKQSAWGGGGRGAIKTSLRHGSKAYELTDQNKSLAEDVEDRRQQIAMLEDQIKALIAQLEKPINLEYFNLK